MILTEMIEQSKINEFKNWLNQYNSYVIIGHIGPDGDAVGSSLGLCHLLEALGKKVQVIMPNEFPTFLEWMAGSENILFFNQSADKVKSSIDKAEVLCLLDFNTLSRVGNDFADIIDSATAKKVMIDHHLYPDDHCDITMSYTKAVATSELIFRLIYQLDMLGKLSKAGAECIYTGMMTDTGAFTYNSNNKEIYTIISLLLGYDIDKDLIYRRVNNTYSECRLRLMGHLLTNMKIYPENAALMTLSEKDMAQFNFVKGDSEGFVNIPLSIKNIICSCMLKEDDELGIIKVSLRSVGDFPCNEMASEFFNGGGHKNASGGEFLGTLEEAISQYEKAIIKYRTQLLA